MSETTTSTHSGLSENAAGAIAYITFIPAIVFLVLPPYNSSSYVRFHAWQSMMLNVAAFIVNMALGMIIALTLFISPHVFNLLIWGIWVVWMLLWVVCVIQAVNGKRFKLPIIGNIAENIANK
jgi:uncharacterized membrane protein